MPTIKQMLTNKTNRPFLRDQNECAIRQLKGIVAHWTANTKKGADARANRNYFNGSAMYASAHYIVDDGEIIQCIPDNEVGYHVGANSYKPDGERIMEKSGLSPNYFLIGFEMCVNDDGDWNGAPGTPSNWPRTSSASTNSRPPTSTDTSISPGKTARK